MITLTDVQKKIDRAFQLGPVTVEVEPGNMIALVGNNGAGKSTLFQVMMGLVKHEEGHIKRLNKGESDLEWKRDFAYVPQSPTSYQGFTLKQMADFFQLSYRGWNREEFERLIQLFDLPLNKRFEKLSVGMQKKAMITLALSRPSKFLLLDEPLAGVDLEGQEQMKDELVHYMERGEQQTILFATHQADEVKTLADFVMLLKNGKLAGQYEKDFLIETWKRLWIRMDEQKVKEIAGVVATAKQGEFVECVTANVQETERDLTENGIKIETVQVMELREILRYLLK
ncbi:ABC transporter ATP-binding protein [bacterium LRH843]|nr:ABC transporter ATP-binding protein [bacterium LRH843]